MRPTASVTTPAGLMRRATGPVLLKSLTPTLPDGSTASATGVLPARNSGICASVPTPESVMLLARADAMVRSTPAALTLRKALSSASMKPPPGADVNPTPLLRMRALPGPPSATPSPSSRDPVNVVTAALPKSI